jgi:hypothetical protein
VARSVPIVAAVIGALGSIVAAVIGVAFQRHDPAAATTPSPIVRTVDSTANGGGDAGDVCLVLDGQVLRFAATYPDAARLYAQPGASSRRLPALATREEVATCGNPRRLLQALLRR